MARRKLDNMQSLSWEELSGRGWYAYKRNGIVTLACTSMQPNWPFTLPSGWRPPIQIEAPVWRMGTGEQNSTVTIDSNGVVKTHNANHFVSGVITYVAA